MRHSPRQYAETLYDLASPLKGEKRRAAVCRFVKRLEGEGSLSLAAEIEREFRAVDFERKGVRQVTVSHAKKVHRGAFTKALGKRRSVIFTNQPELLGGVTIEDGDLRIDGSLRRRLVEVRRAMGV
jgi:F0F1-type ATP synthase delta subunit